MSFKEWLTEELKSTEQKNAEQERANARQKEAEDRSRRELLLEWSTEVYRLFNEALGPLTRTGAQVSLSMSATEPALSWGDGRKLEVAQIGPYELAVRREGARTVATVKSIILPGGMASLVDGNGRTAYAEQMLKPLVLAAAKNES